MTRRSRKKTGRKNRRMGRRTFLLGAGAAACVAARIKKAVYIIKVQKRTVQNERRCICEKLFCTLC